MICPHCSHDNISGVDMCEECAQPLVEFDPVGGELEESITRHDVRVLAHKPPSAVDASATVRDAIAELVKQSTGCLLVETDGQVVGVFTERDVLNKISSDLATLDRPVSEFMTSDPETITKDDSIAYALHAMDLGGYRHMPIVNSSGEPIGILSVRDILRFLCIRFAQLRTQAG